MSIARSGVYPRSPQYTAANTEVPIVTVGVNGMWGGPQETPAIMTSRVAGIRRNARKRSFRDFEITRLWGKYLLIAPSSPFTNNKSGFKINVHLNINYSSEQMSLLRGLLRFFNNHTISISIVYISEIPQK